MIFFIIDAIFMTAIDEYLDPYNIHRGNFYSFLSVSFSLSLALYLTPTHTDTHAHAHALTHMHSHTHFVYPLAFN